MTLLRYVLSFFRDDRKSRFSECAICPVERRRITAKESREMLTAATKRFNDTVTLHPEQARALLEQVHNRRSGS